ncbi:MAG TPA: SMP-30/gluconolactonase/LRE family protein [Intrasporangium sp.]|uniref:SMP-30/gluconolactonase/LRE family protein n=1 Tax=Intrasporangium sp. TaxID=1925024 RepID=UPI002D78FDC2|nr:SMP-30/gluconolactonase/LRE family protein [Intrasporangium sp.]HET7398827.1 SMP-30/gluconolactonase/LRE family protein [Intrasporangium sp.]
MRAHQLTDPVAYHGEGPVWSPRWGGLRWVDLLAGDVLSLQPDGVVTRRSVGEVAAALRPRPGGGAVLAVERGFALEDVHGTVTALPPVLPPGTRMNDGGCDPDGRFYCGSMAYDHRTGAAALHRLDPDGSTHVVLSGLTISNGLDWTPDGSRAYYVDTPTGRVDAFDYDPASGLTGRRPFVTFPEDGGHPDGLTVDAAGGVWVAAYGAGAVRHYTAAGVLDAVVEVPARQVTACTLGGEGLDELFITTSREGLAAGDDPLAGALFSVSGVAPGQPVREFAG